MADTGERRQIVGRANAKEAEKVRASKKMVSEEHATENANHVAFGLAARGSRRRAASGTKPRSPDSKPSKP